MATKTIAWGTGDGNITVNYGGSGNGTISISSDGNNLHSDRSKEITVKTTDGSITRKITVSQAAKPYISLNNAVVTAPTQTYTGSALKPTPTVTLDGIVVAATNYDVSWSNNTNAGTGTVTVTGKGDYNGSASGTFTITQREVTLNWGTLTWTYDGSAHSTTCTAGNLVSGDSCAVTLTGNSITNAGSTTVTASSLSNGNYKLPSSNAATLTVNALTITIPDPTGVSRAYNGTAATASFGAATGAGITKYRYSTNGSSWTETTTNPSQTNAGTLYVQAYYSANANYTGSGWSTSATLAISKASRTLSFADANVIMDINSTYTQTVYVSAGSGDGAITYSVNDTSYATVNSSTGAVASKSYDGSITVTASIAEGTNYLSSSAAYNITIFATVHDFDYTGSAQSIGLIAGSYKLQCWGAQGSANMVNSSYGITAQAGGKGGYSEGVLRVSTARALKVFVGGQGGYNGGGSVPTYSSYDAGNEFGISYMGSGGGASDVRLSDGELLSRMIVAGGGSGGAMSYKKVTSSTTTTVLGISDTKANWQFYDPNGHIGNASSYSTSDGNASIASTTSADLSNVQLCLDLSSYTFPVTVSFDVDSMGGSGTLRLAKAVNRTSWTSPYTSEFVTLGSGKGSKKFTLTDSTHPVLFYYCNDNKPGISIIRTKVTKITNSSNLKDFSSGKYGSNCFMLYDVNVTAGETYNVYAGTSDGTIVRIYTYNSSGTQINSKTNLPANTWFTYTAPSNASWISLQIGNVNSYPSTTNVSMQQVNVTETTQTDAQVGYVGGGTSGGGYSTAYAGKQNAAGSGGAFGQGAGHSVSNYRYCAAGGGGGWYGGGTTYSDSGITYCRISGGGSGFVNTAANASYRPSGYTGLELDSGSTYAGNTTFVAPGGGNETGHAGNGYVRITRL